MAVRFAARLDDAEWLVDSSVFACRLSHPVPDFGLAVFETRAGFSQDFRLQARSQPFRAGPARLSADAPPWDPARIAVDLGSAQTRAERQALHLEAVLAQRVLDSLNGGMAPVLRQQGASADNLTVEVALSSAGFRAAYRHYRQCLVQLLPVSFEQIARSWVRFAAGEWELDGAAREQLDLIVRYASADRAVTELFVDGHTDAAGRRLYNLELSKKRAEEVTRYLVANGIPEDLIVTRYHGERYPVAPNGTAERTDNRRVTIRLQRSEA